MEPLRIGGRTVSREDARAYARRYLTEGGGWAYPSYDGFDAVQARGPLTDGDLLTPLLLNVRHLSLRTHEALQRVRPELQSALDDLAPALSLLTARPADLEVLARLFAVLDGRAVHGVRGTVLSKILHRKRPGFIPLYDEQVRRVYQDGPQAPVPTVTGRPWSAFFPLFAQAVRIDLERELPFWEEVASYAAGPAIGPLRALDIVAWWAGAQGEEAAPEPPVAAEEV